MQSLINDSRVKVIVKTYEVAVLRYGVYFEFFLRKEKWNFDEKMTSFYKKNKK